MITSIIKKASAFVQSFFQSPMFQDRQVNNLFVLNFAILGTNAILMPVRESLTLEGGKALQTKLMMLTVVASIIGQAMFAYYSGKYGGLETLRGCLFISSLSCFATYGCLVLVPRVSILLSSMFYLWFTFYNMTSMSTFWAIAGDILEEGTSNKGEQEEKKNSNKKLANGSIKDNDDSPLKSKKRDNNGGSGISGGNGQVVKKIGVFSLLGAGGTLGSMSGSYSVSLLIKWMGSLNTLVFLGIAFMLSITLCQRIEQEKNYRSSEKGHAVNTSSNNEESSNKTRVRSSSSASRIRGSVSKGAVSDEEGVEGRDIGSRGRGGGGGRGRARSSSRGRHVDNGDVDGDETTMNAGGDGANGHGIGKKSSDRKAAVATTRGRSTSSRGRNAASTLVSVTTVVEPSSSSSSSSSSNKRNSRSKSPHRSKIEPNKGQQQDKGQTQASRSLLSSSSSSSSSSSLSLTASLSMTDNSTTTPPNHLSVLSLWDTLQSELRDQILNVGAIWDNPLLLYSFTYSVLLSTSLGLTVIERTVTAKATGLDADAYANILAGNQTTHGILQFTMQFFGASTFLSLIGTSAALNAAAWFRFLSFVGFFAVQSGWMPSAFIAWFHLHPMTPITFVIVSDLLCRLATQTLSKPVRESLWTLIPPSSKYRAKIIVDVLAHRIGTSLAACLANLPLVWAINTLVSYGPRASTAVSGTSPWLACQDHILWGVLVTAVFLTFSVRLGAALTHAHAKRTAAAAVDGGGTLSSGSKKKN